MKIPWRIIAISVGTIMLLTAGLIAYQNMQSDNAVGRNGEDEWETGEWPTEEYEPEPSPEPTPTLPPLPTATPFPTPTAEPTKVPLIELYRDTSPIAGRYMEWVVFVETAAERAHATAREAQVNGTLAGLVRADQTARFAASVARSKPVEVTEDLPGYNRAMNAVEILTVFYGDETWDLTRLHEALTKSAEELCNTAIPTECFRTTEWMETVEEINGRMSGQGQEIDAQGLLDGSRSYDESVIRLVETDPIIQSHIRQVNEVLYEGTRALLAESTKLREELERVVKLITEFDRE